MLKIYIQSKKDGSKELSLLENGKLVEYYNQTQNPFRKEGNIYVGFVKNIIKGMQAAFIDIGTDKNSFIHLKDVLPKIDETKNNLDLSVKIEKVLKESQKLVVQVKKDSNNKKGARVSTHINLPGKFVALMPETDIITVSQKITDTKEKERLKDIVKKYISKTNGVVIRTSAVGIDEESIAKDILKLEKKWKAIKTLSEVNDNKPKLIYSSEEIIEKIFIDLYKEKKIKVITNNKEEKIELEKLIESEEYINVKVEYEECEELFEKHELNSQIEKIKNNRIWLKSGGFITIDSTEALTAIDVNTGKYTGKTNIEDTVFEINKEATIEIAKQLRLRDVGGIIIIDYIDMRNQKNKDEVKKILDDETKKDRAKLQIEGFTKLELMELTRKHICSHID